MEPSTDSRPVLRLPLWQKLRRSIFGPARDLRDPALAHKVSLIAFLAWVGLGADGLSSSAYGPDIAFRALGQHTYLALALALMTAATVFIISYAYSRIIEHFPLGGGGYIVASALLGKNAGVVSGCALLVDYILTVTVSIAGGGNAIFSLLPIEWQAWKLPVEFSAIFILILMNLRGVKESVTLLTPIFLTFLATHFFLIFGGISLQFGELPNALNQASAGLDADVSQFGKWGVFLILLRAYAIGGGTYTGIEAVSNGVGIMREPRVETGKRTMRYMAISLAVTAAGLLVCYMLANVRPVEGQTLNAVLANKIAGAFTLGSFPIGYWFVAVTMFAEGILLLVAAQTGFIDGPRVMANMAVDGWLPRSLVALSDRLTIQNGILLIGFASSVLLAYTSGHIELLVVMYSLNVFLTFTLSQTAMLRFWTNRRKSDPSWIRHLPIHTTGLVLCLCIFCLMLFEKFTHGAWLTLVITSVFILFCLAIRHHYRSAAARVAEVDRILLNIPTSPVAPGTPPEFDPKKPTAAILISSYNGLGVHILLSVFRLFSNSFQNVVFVSVGVINSDFFKEGTKQVESLDEKTTRMLEQYVDLCRRLGIPARSVHRVGTEIVQEVSELCIQLSRDYPRVVFFAGESVFENLHWWHRFLHNDTAFAIQRRIRLAGLPMVLMPVVIPKKP